MVNPFGTTYHPLAIHKLLSYAIYQEAPAPHTYLENQDIAYNYDFHSSLSALGRPTLQKTIQELIGITHYFIKDCRFLLLTYGTAWVYERVDTGEVVANCHKMNASLFTQRLATVEEITSSAVEVVNAIRSINPSVRVILTVSPVRHVRDTLPLNSLSKSTLRVACHEISQAIADTEYFPAYEILMDDLRDYRFYRDDLIHPTELAEDIIWLKFGDAFFDKDTKAFIKQWEHVLENLAHKPFHPGRPSHRQFLVKTLDELNQLSAHVNVAHEIEQVKSMLMESPIDP